MIRSVFLKLLPFFQPTFNPFKHLNMAELVQVDPFNYDIDRFDIDPKSVKPQSFKDEKTGKDQTYFTGILLYCDPTDNIYRPPFFLTEGDSYGIQKADENKKDTAVKPVLPQMVQLPSALAPGAQTSTDGKREKWQVSISLSAKPAEKDWTKEEAHLISFIDSQLRRILAHVLVKRIEILQTIGSKAIDGAREALGKEMQQNPGKYNTQEAQLSRMKEMIEDLLYNTISRKVYRAKKKAAPEAPGAPGGMNLLDASAGYDETKYPTLYSSIPSFLNKTTKTEEFVSRYYKFVDGEPEENWPQLTHPEALALGRHRVRVANRFDNIYFGASIAPQIKAAEVVFLKAISGGLGHKGRLIKAGPEVPRTPHLITRTAIQPAGANNNNRPELGAPQQNFQPAASVSMAFDPNALAGVPGIGGLPAPQIVGAGSFAPVTAFPPQ